jgi:hypothetical protein
MDSPIVAQLFRQLLRHRQCPLLASQCSQAGRRSIQLRPGATSSPGRAISYNRKKDDGTLWRHRSDYFPKDMSKEALEYPMVTASQLRLKPNRPKRVKMLTRDFIEGTNH